MGTSKHLGQPDKSRWGGYMELTSVPSREISSTPCRLMLWKLELRTIRTHTNRREASGATQLQGLHKHTESNGLYLTK